MFTIRVKVKAPFGAGGVDETRTGNAATKLKAVLFFGTRKSGSGGGLSRCREIAMLDKGIMQVQPKEEVRNGVWNAIYGRKKKQIEALFREERKFA